MKDTDIGTFIIPVQIVGPLPMPSQTGPGRERGAVTIPLQVRVLSDKVLYVEQVQDGVEQVQVGVE